MQTCHGKPLAQALSFLICFGLLGSSASPSYAQSPEQEAPIEIEPTIPDPYVALAPEALDALGGVDAVLARAQALSRAGDTQRASALCRRIIDSFPRGHLAALQLQRKILIKAQRPTLLVSVDEALIRVYQAHAQRGLAQSVLSELRALDPEHPSLDELTTLIAGTNSNAPTLEEDGLHLRSLLGIVVFLCIAVLLSNARKSISWRLVIWGLGLQFLFAVLILKTQPGHMLFDLARELIQKILSFTDAGAGFLFGSLYNGIVSNGASGPVQVLDASTGDFQGLGVIFAFHILPTVIFFGALMSVLYHFGLIQRLVRSLAWVMNKTMGTSGSESLSAAANIFVGQTEAPLVIKPYIMGMTMSELMAVMTGGFATVAGGVLAAYARFGIDPGHLLAASVMSAPAALVMAKIMYPETEESKTQQGKLDTPAPETSNVLDAAAAGATDGLKLALNVAAMLIAFIALIAMADWLLSVGGNLIGLEGLSLSRIFGWVFYPLSWCMGVAEADLMTFGELLGAKIAINEFVAFVELGHASATMDPRSTVIATYALCGFANFSSIGIQIGGISGIAPERRSDLAVIGLKAMAGGAMASWITACIAGLLL